MLWYAPKASRLAKQIFYQRRNIRIGRLEVNTVVADRGSNTASFWQRWRKDTDTLKGDPSRWG